MNMKSIMIVVVILLFSSIVFCNEVTIPLYRVSSSCFIMPKTEFSLGYYKARIIFLSRDENIEKRMGLCIQEDVELFIENIETFINWVELANINGIAFDDKYLKNNPIGIWMYRNKRTETNMKMTYRRNNLIIESSSKKINAGFFRKTEPHVFVLSYKEAKILLDEYRKSIN